MTFLTRLTVTMFILAASTPTFAAEPICGDVNDSGSINTTDALLVLKKGVGQSVVLPCGLYESAIETCQDGYDTAISNLAICTSSLSDCDASLETCTSDSSACITDLDLCNQNLSACVSRPTAAPHKTGQTTCYTAAGTPIECSNTGQDGEHQEGIANDFVDNGDGIDLPRFRGHPNQHESAIGESHVETETENLYT